MAFWEWVKSSRRYRLTREGAAALGGRAGTFVGQKQMVILRDQYIQKNLLQVAALGENLVGGGSIGSWVTGMRGQIKNAYINEYLLAAGGRNNMSPADWGRIGAEIRKQYRFLDRFANDIAAGNLTEKQIQARAAQYINGSTSMYERANTATREMPQLPQYPADGNQDCHSNCKCSWDIKEKQDSWECYWIIDAAAEHCDTCIENSIKYNPLVIMR